MYTRVVYGKRDTLYNYSEFICDSDSDIENLPTTKSEDGCSVGSKAFVTETKKKYMLNNKDEWCFLGYAVTGSMDSVDVASKQDVLSFFGE